MRFPENMTDADIEAATDEQNETNPYRGCTCSRGYAEAPENDCSWCQWEYADD